MKVVIIGGVAAGASAAARLRRLDEKSEIVLLERGKYISYANCGLPYHLSGVIPERENLLVISANAFAARFNVDVRIESEAAAITANHTVMVRHNGETYEEPFDKLLIATGSSPISMDLPGLDPAKVRQFWTIPDMDEVLKSVESGIKKTVVVGAGFIGLEVAENLRARGLEVTIVELAPQVLPTIDAEMSSYLAQELLNAGIALKLGRKVAKFEHEDGFCAVLDDGEKISAGLVLMCVGVKPNSALAKEAGLELGARGHILVNQHLQTSHPDIYAAGDVCEISDPANGMTGAIPLAGPANKQGRIAAGNIAGGDAVYPGSPGAAVIKVGKLTAANVGLTERRARQLNLPYHKIYTHPGSNASYYPAGAMLHMKLLFAPDGVILGAQAVGAKGADKRIDVIAVAMQSGKKACDLAALELAYAPPYNSAKDPVNFLGMIAQNMTQKLTDPVYADALPDAVFLDVREPAEFATGSIPGAVNMPLGQLRSRLDTLDKTRNYITFCQVGMRGYVAERMLKQNGFSCRNLSGGLLTWRSFHQTPKAMVFSPAPAAAPVAAPEAAYRIVDVRALSCPGPVVKLKKAMDDLPDGGTLKLLAQGTFAPDLNNWLTGCGHTLLSLEMKGDDLEAVIRKKGAAPSDAIPAATAVKNNDAAIILFSNDLDKAMAALIVACGMAATGGRVTIFFTFWGLSVLRKNPAPGVKKSLISRMFGAMLPKGAQKLTLSKMNMAGMGTMMMKQVMARENVSSLPELLDQARGLGVKFIACEMAMNVMGLQREELIEVDEVAGVASFASIAREAGTSLFI